MPLHDLSGRYVGRMRENGRSQEADRLGLRIPSSTPSIASFLRRNLTHTCRHAIIFDVIPLVTFFERLVNFEDTS